MYEEEKVNSLVASCLIFLGFPSNFSCKIGTNSPLFRGKNIRDKSEIESQDWWLFAETSSCRRKADRDVFGNWTESTVGAEKGSKSYAEDKAKDVFGDLIFCELLLPSHNNFRR
jgi:hypothetical protein